MATSDQYPAECPHCGATLPSTSDAFCLSCREALDESIQCVRTPRAEGGIREAINPVIDRKFIKRFRDQIHALGGLWIIIGSLVLGIPVVALVSSRDLGASFVGSKDFYVLIIVAGLGMIWFALGVLTCRKQMWALHVALVLSYLSLVGQVLNFNLCGAVLLIVVVLQAHRVIGWAGTMNVAGVPLTTRPDEAPG